MVIAYERRAVKEIVELKYFQILWVVLKSTTHIYHAYNHIYVYVHLNDGITKIVGANINSIDTIIHFLDIVHVFVVVGVYYNNPDTSELYLYCPYVFIYINSTTLELNK